jgi:hypothetical protein
VVWQNELFNISIAGWEKANSRLDFEEVLLMRASG